MGHFIWVFTLCHSICLEVSGLQWVNKNSKQPVFTKLVSKLMRLVLIAYMTKHQGYKTFMGGSRGVGTGGPNPPEKSQKYRFFSNIGPDRLKNHKATKPAFNVGPILAHFDLYLDQSSRLHHLKNKTKKKPRQSWTPTGKTCMLNSTELFVNVPIII